MKNYLSIILMLVGLSVSVNATATTTEPTPPESNPEFMNFTYQVKHIEDFMSRFNGETYVIDSTQIDNWKCNNLLFLFDEKTYHAHENMVDTLIRMQLDSVCRLEYTASNWTATAECNVLYKGVKKTIFLTLKTEKIEDYIYKWVIVDAHGDILDLTPAKRNPGLRISPTDNEVDFISLSHITSTEAVNILNYTEKNYQPDCLSVFYALIYTKQLKVETVQQVVYKFYDIHGFDFQVERHLEDKVHSGWLITDIKHHE